MANPIDTLLALAEEHDQAATKGPWSVDTNVRCIREGGDPRVAYRKHIHLEHWMNPEEPNSIVKGQRKRLEFIAASRTAWPATARALKVAREALLRYTERPFINAVAELALAELDRIAADGVKG